MNYTVGTITLDCPTSFVLYSSDLVINGSDSKPINVTKTSWRIH